jgi:hypothetical protein
MQYDTFLGTKRMDFAPNATLSLLMVAFSLIALDKEII